MKTNLLTSVPSKSPAILQSFEVAISTNLIDNKGAWAWANAILRTQPDNQIKKFDNQEATAKETVGCTWDCPGPSDNEENFDYTLDIASVLFSIAILPVRFRVKKPGMAHWWLRGFEESRFCTLQPKTAEKLKKVISQQHVSWQAAPIVSTSTTTSRHLF